MSRSYHTPVKMSMENINRDSAVYGIRLSFMLNHITVITRRVQVHCWCNYALVPVAKFVFLLIWTVTLELDLRRNFVYSVLR